MPEDLLCDKIDYFRAAFKGGFLEGSKKVIWLEEEDPTAFGQVLDWLFGEEHSCPPRICPVGNKPSDTANNAAHYLAWCKFWVLVDKLGFRDLPHVTRFRFRCCLRRSLPDSTSDLHGDSRPADSCSPFLSPEIVRYVYEHTGEGSKLRHSLVTFSVIYLNHRYTKNMAAWSEALSSNLEFAREVSQALKKHNSIEDTKCKFPKCDVHPDVMESDDSVDSISDSD